MQLCGFRSALSSGTVFAAALVCAHAENVIPARSLRGQVFPACSSMAGFETARLQWCGDQKGAYACSKHPLSGNPWDCNMETPGFCGADAQLCLWDVSPADPEEPLLPAKQMYPVTPDDEVEAMAATNITSVDLPIRAANQTMQMVSGAPVRFMSWNVYYRNLAARVHDIAAGIRQVNPEIVSLQETVEDKAMILEALNQQTGHEWSMSASSGCPWYFDGIIFFRSDIWEALDSGSKAYGGGGCYSGSNRGMNWAALRRKWDGAGILVYGTHPVCCQGDGPVLQALTMISYDMKYRQEKFGFPVALMGDLNVGMDQPSQTLLRSGHTNGRSIPLSFHDAYADANPNNPNPSTIQNYPVRIDYVYFQKSPIELGKQTGGKVWYGLPGGSDHRAVSADIVVR